MSHVITLIIQNIDKHYIHLQTSVITDNGFFTLRRNQKFMTILKSPFKSLPVIHNEKKGLVRTGSEGSTVHRAVESGSDVC